MKKVVSQSMVFVVVFYILLNGISTGYFDHDLTHVDSTLSQVARTLSKAVSRILGVNVGSVLLTRL